MMSDLWSHAWFAMPDGVVVLDPGWRISFLNEAGSRIIRHPVAEVVGHELWTIFPSTADSPFETQLRRARDTGTTVSWESSFSAELGYFEIRAFPVDADLMVVFRNVDDRREVELQRERLLARTRLLLSLAEALADTSTVDEVAVTIINTATHELSTVHAGLSLVEDNFSGVRVLGIGRLHEQVENGWHHLPYDHPGVVPLVSRRGVPVFLETFADVTASFPASAASFSAAGLCSAAVVPLVVNGRVLGALSLAWAGDHPMDLDERATILALAGYAAQAVTRAQDQQFHATAAETLQRAMLTELPQQPDLALAARYLPARTGAQVGGDWYDALVLPDGAMALVIGDVSGHDIGAAASMGQLRSVLRSFACAFPEPPSLVLGRLDAAVAAMRMDVVATVVLARVEAAPAHCPPGTRTLRWSNAGHPPPLLVLPDGSVRLLENDPELILGIDPATDRSDHVALLPPDGVLLFYTDGLIEHRGSDLASGLDRLVTTVCTWAANRQLRGEDALADLLDCLTFRLAAEPEDDIALLAVRLGTPTA